MEEDNESSTRYIKFDDIFHDESIYLSGIGHRDSGLGDDHQSHHGSELGSEFGSSDDVDIED